VDEAESILPGGGEFNILRDFADSSDIDILNPDTTLITSGTADVTGTSWTVVTQRRMALQKLIHWVMPSFY